MTAVWPVLSFFLGGTVAFALQYVSYRFTQRREYWIRRLNSYQDFCHQSAQLVDLLIAGIDVPPDRCWAAVAEARKAAYDAEFYDPDSPERWTEMQEITIELASAAAASQETLPRSRISSGASLRSVKTRITATRACAAVPPAPQNRSFGPVHD